MTAEIIFFILFLSIIIGLLRWSLNKRKDFKDIIEPKLKLHRLKFVSSVYPGLFNVGPFKKIEFEFGKPQLNNGTIQYEHTYYRKITIMTTENVHKEIWAKIETSWFKDTTVEYNPELNEIN